VGQRLDGGGDQRADARHRHEPARNVVGLRPRGDLGIERSGLLLEVAQHADEHGEASAGGLWQVGGGILDLRDQPLDVETALRRDQVNFGQLPTDRVDYLRALANPPAPSAEMGNADERLRCRCCGGPMTIIETFARGALPRTWPAATIRIDTS
jgi:hypothetical protein